MKPAHKCCLNALSICLVFVFSFSQAQNLVAETLDKLVHASALVSVADAQKKFLKHGSGTLVSAQAGVAYVLSNFHVVANTTNLKVFPNLYLGFPEQQENAPKLRYLGEVVLQDPKMDLALIKISKDSNGNTLSPNHRFPEPARVGNSDKLKIAENVYALGYPGLGGFTISFSQGVVNGFVGQDGSSSGRDWIKHSANISPGNSGGGLFNANGELIGINTLVVSETRTAGRQPLARSTAVVAEFLSKIPNALIENGLLRQNNIQTAPVQNSNAGSLAGLAAWPPQLEINQQWNVEMQSVGNFSIVFNQKYNDGVPYGFIKFDGQNFLAVFHYVKSLDVVALELSQDGTAKNICLFQRGEIQGISFEGSLYSIETEGLAKTANACTMRFAGMAGASSTKPIAPSKAVAPTVSTPPATSTTTSLGKDWPPNFVVGQTWSVVIEGRGTWTIQLLSQDPNGGYRGKATGSSNLSVFLSYDANEDVVLVVLHDAVSALLCASEKGDLKTGVLYGQAGFIPKKDAQIQDIGRCRITP